MKKQIKTEQGVCNASKSAREIKVIRKEIQKDRWIAETSRWISAIQDPTRFKIVYLLYRYEQLCGCDLANILGVSHSAISQHLRKLKDMQLLSQVRRGQTLFYGLSHSKFNEFVARIFQNEEILA